MIADLYKRLKNNDKLPDLVVIIIHLTAHMIFRIYDAFPKLIRHEKYRAIVAVLVFSISLPVLNPVHAEDKAADLGITEMIQNMKKNGRTVIVDRAKDDVTESFMKWYGRGRMENDVLEYMISNDLSFLMEWDKSYTGRFETRTVTQLYVDSFSYRNNNNTLKVYYTTEISGTVTDNADTYDVVNVFSPTVTVHVKSDDADVYPNGYSVSAAVSTDRTCGEVRGIFDLYAGSSSDRDTSSARQLKRVVQVMKVQA